MQGAAAGIGAGVAGAAARAALAEEQAPQAEGAEGAAAEAEAATPEPVETYDCDIVVVGSGSSGLAACVQAGELGASVICLERNAVVGGNGLLTDGMFAIDSSIEKEQGIVADAGALVRSELEFSQFRGSGAGLVDLVRHSGENIDWLLEQGVTFTLVEHETFHNFSGGYNGGGAEHYAKPMLAKAEGYGVQFLTETLATGLIQDESGAVTGVIAQGPQGTVQVNAKAVLLAGGGFVESRRYMADQFGIDIDTEVTFLANPGHDGTTIEMAIAAGAKSNMNNAGLQLCMQVVGLPDYIAGGQLSESLGTVAPFGIWLNQDAKRFVNEDCAQSNWALADMSTLVNKETFVLMDQPMFDKYVEGLPNDGYIADPTPEKVDAEVEQGIELGKILKADTLEEVESWAGFESGALAGTVEDYNALVASGIDSDFGKDPGFLMELATPPFYAFHIGHLVICSFAGVTTDLSCRALDGDGEPIPGLYVIGVDGTMLWASEYTLALPGGTNASNVHSGRVAAKHAVASLG